MLEDLHKVWRPHPAQLQPAYDLFYGGVKRLFMCLGRRFGKSALMCYFAVRWALTRPKSHIYILGPFLTTEREIILASGLLLEMVPRKYMVDYNKTEGRVNFTNGSFIRVMGADQPESLRGLEVHLLLIDEVKDIKADVINIVSPTLIDNAAPMILSGTPPDVAEHPFWEHVERAKTSEKWRFYHGTSYDNPHINREALDEEREAYRARGDEDVFAREFLAQYVPGGKRAVFPMLTTEHVLPYALLYNRIQRNHNQWQFYITLDPGTASCFAATLHAVNPYRGSVYVMDEVYEQQQSETSIGKIWPRIKGKMDELHLPDHFDEAPWTVTVDEAATWARNELLDQFGFASFPTAKAQHRKADGVSLLKDLLRSRKMLMSDRCVATYKELAGYMLDKNGQYVKKNDHAIDTLRYTLAAANYTFVETVAPTVADPIPEDEKRRAFTPEEDFRNSFGPLEDLYMLDMLD